MGFMSSVIKQAKEDPKRIAFPESDEPRTVKAVCRIVKEGIAVPVLIGSRERLEGVYPKNTSSKVEIVDHDDKIVFRFIQRLLVIRKDKGLTYPQAREILKDPMYLAAMLLMLATSMAWCQALLIRLRIH